MVMFSLAAGIAVGAAGCTPPRWYDWVAKITTWLLFAMLAALGALLGLNQALVADLAGIGGQSLLLAVATVAGSMLGIGAVLRWGRWGKRGER